MKLMAMAAFALCLSFTNPTRAQVTRESVVQAYSQKVFEQYSSALAGAREIQKSIELFLNDPSEKNLAVARQTWIEARKAYSQTEVYRFYGGPIDNENGPEGLINAWPLDEVYIDTIVERTDLYPSLSAEVLSGLNEKDGEKNISTGYHGIEYLLWGQDLSADGPGARPASDFAPENPLAARRAEYLRTVTALLVADLESVQVQWTPNTAGNYASSFNADADTALLNMLTGVTKLGGAELSQERMFVALDTRSQEEEHSCFSDTTHFDILYNFLGIKNVMTGGVLDLIRQSDAISADEIEANLVATEAAVRAIPAPFDQAIVNEEARAKVLDAIKALETLTESVRQGGYSIGIELP